MKYRVQTLFMRDNPVIRVVGCGGTGGYVAELLCRLFTGREMRLTLQDHDRIEPHNLLRQNFYPDELGEFKSKALATRLSRQFHRAIGYSIYPYKAENERLYDGMDTVSGLWATHGPLDLTIGCVDNALARQHMAVGIRGEKWWIDAGNGETWGQVLLGGGPPDFSRERSWAFTRNGVCHALPLPTVQRPDLLENQPDVRPDLDCAAALDLTDQDPTINHMMASLVVQVVRRMAAGTCPWMALYLNLEAGTVHPIYATAEEVSKVTGVKVKDLEQRPFYVRGGKSLIDVYADELEEKPRGYVAEAE